MTYNKIIAFFFTPISNRGSAVAVFDYALHNQRILNNKSIIIHHNSPEDDPTIVLRFKNNFDCYHFSADKGEIINIIDHLIEYTKTDILYTIKYGIDDKLISYKYPTVVHAIFSAAQPHGDIFATISPHTQLYNESIPIVPHMIDLPNNDLNLRECLKIPQDATVFARYGGYHQFDIQFVHKTIINYAKTHHNVYFLFANTHPFITNPVKNIIFINHIPDPVTKVAFINTADAMIHARSDGEVFSLAMGEFAIKNKPIITSAINFYNRNRYDTGHIHMLAQKAFWYTCEESLYSILDDFILNKNIYAKLDWNSYKKYTPEYVMQIFNNVFITPISHKAILGEEK